MRNIDDKRICKLVTHFRMAIEDACKEGCFDKDFVFHSFPRACCGDTCYLLAEYLHSKGIDTIYVWGDYDGQSHAWLVVKDYRVKNPTKRFYIVPEEIRQVLNFYGSDIDDEPKDVTRYEEDDLIDGLIIDITADQFGEEPVYVNYMDDFHRKFEFEAAHDCEGVYNARLDNLYRIIAEFIS